MAVDKLHIPKFNHLPSYIREKASPKSCPIFSRENESLHQNFRVLSSIAKSKFHIYKVETELDKRQLALKVFPFEGKNPNKYYRNEKKAMKFDHPNIIKVFGYEDKKKIAGKELQAQFGSYVLMELAPFGDLQELISSTNILQQNEKLLRTYFHQIISALEYLHKEKGTAHLDVKCENFLIGQGFNLKLCDFDFCYSSDEGKPLGKGTPIFRAPELEELQQLEHPEKADIYSAGVMLFTMKLGLFPFLEGEEVANYDLKKLIFEEPNKFWEAHCKVQGKMHLCSDSFKKLIEMMIKKDSEQRASFDEIKTSDWYKGPVLSEDEVFETMFDIYQDE